MKRASDEPWPPSCANCEGPLTRSALGALCRSCIDAGVTLRAQLADERELTDWLAGPGLAHWIASRPVHPALALDERLASRVESWREGATASVYDADEVLTALGFNLAGLPDDLWVNASPRTAVRHRCAEIRDEVLARLERGERASDLASLFGIHRQRISDWRRKGRQDRPASMEHYSAPKRSHICGCGSNAAYRDLEGDEICVSCGAYQPQGGAAVIDFPVVVAMARAAA